MHNTFEQLDWSEAVEKSAGRLVRLAIAEDLGNQGDWTTTALVPREARGEAAVVAREAGVVAGMHVVPLVIDELAAETQVAVDVEDGARIDAGQTLATLTGSAAGMLKAERICLNFLGRLSGIATLTRQYVDAVAGTGVHVYDTRKTTPAWRLLEKYAVRCGGGYNHRLGLDRAVMIKDNHVALAHQEGYSLPAAIEQVRSSLAARHSSVEAIEVEVDSLHQLEAVLAVNPDIVLLDNMSTADLAEAAAMRDRIARDVVLEASGGIDLKTIAEIAKTGVDRVSVGALTHSAPSLDIGLDWRP